MEIRLILGDQLNLDHSWLRSTSDEVTYVMFEMHQETSYVRHHVQKVLAFFLAMRSFKDSLKSQGHQVVYYTLDDPPNTGSLKDNLLQIFTEKKATSWAYQLPDEYRLDEQLQEIADIADIPVTVVDTEHFLSERNALATFFGEKTKVMERFYRMMRAKYDVLMDGDDPATGKWNYDHENRKKLPKKMELPSPKVFRKDVSPLFAMLQEQGIETIGNVEQDNFIWPVSYEEGQEMLQHFVDHLLPHFGLYQDAMTTKDWSLFHSRLSFLMNAKILQPLEVIRKVEEAWTLHPEKYTIAQVEGFIRQILGWREYMRGIYWAYMPDFAGMNYFQNERSLPSWFWTGKTKMRCCGHAIQQSLDHAYAHHIQRLMVTGNFALLTGIDPDEIDQWYLGIYIDAIEWVEITNTRGMSQFADGGIVGTKPYISSGSYINKMSHYCGDCSYDVKDKTGPQACPFNSLYWNFLEGHRDQLSSNPRMSMMYRVWDKMDGEVKSDILKKAEDCLENIEML